MCRPLAGDVLERRLWTDGHVALVNCIPGHLFRATSSRAFEGFRSLSAMIVFGGEMDSHNQCPKCNREMKQGFILDHKDYASSVVAQWQPGEPRKSFWRGVQTKDGPQYEITAYRCTVCGYLESYAK